MLLNQDQDLLADLSIAICSSLIRARPPPLIRAMHERIFFFYMRCSLMFHRIASLSKRVTEMTVLALLDRGLLDLDSKVIF